MTNIKIRSANYEISLGNIKANIEKIKKLISDAEKDRVNILSLPELSLTGASLYDGYKDKDILEACENGLIDLLDFSRDKDLLFSLGLPIQTEFGLFNAIALIKEGEILSIYTKENLKPYEKTIFSSKACGYIRAFDYSLDEDPSYLTLISGIKIGVSIGEDEKASIAKSLKLKAQGADIILNPSAVARDVFSGEKIRKDIEFLSKDIIYVHTSTGFGESSTDLVYTGANIIARDGLILEESTGIFDLDLVNEDWMINFNNFTDELYYVDKFPYLPKETYSKSYMEEAIEIQALGLLRRMKAIGTDRVFLGVSGGIDSTAVLLAIDRAFELGKFDKKNIGAYTMPAFGTSDRTKSNAYKLCESLGIELKEINISKSVKYHLADIGHDGKTPDLAYENSQARMRTQVLFNLSNMYGGIVIGTGDLSENMQGFATYNGDHMSSYSLNGSLTKTELRYILKSMAHFTDNKNLSEVLTDILDTPVSPELVSKDRNEISQKTEEIIGPYELIDFFIYHHLTYNKKALDIVKEAEIAFADTYDRSTIKKWLISYFKRFAASQFKRSCSVDGVNVTGRSFSPRLGYKIPSDMSADVYLEGLI